MTDSFHNEPIPVDQLPRLADDAFVPVDPRYLKVSMAGFAFAVAVIAVGMALVASRASRPTPLFLIGGAAFVLVSLAAIVRVLEVRRLAYQLREHDLSLRSGVFTHRVDSLPFSRVQHVNINRGPVERWLGLATLSVSTAGPDISIPGLAHEDAERMKLLVTQRAGVDGDDTGDLVALGGGDEGDRDPDFESRLADNGLVAQPASLPPPPPPASDR